RAADLIRHVVLLERVRERLELMLRAREDQEVFWLAIAGCDAFADPAAKACRIRPRDVDPAAAGISIESIEGDLSVLRTIGTRQQRRIRRLVQLRIIAWWEALLERGVHERADLPC